MAAEAGAARAMERLPGQPAGKTGPAPQNQEAGMGRETQGIETGGSEAEEDGRWRPMLALPCELVVDLPLPGFKIADLLKLRPGSVVNAQWHVGHDVPLRLNGTLIGWIEFEVAGSHLAVRLTELA